MRSNQVPSKHEKTPPWKPERFRAGWPALVLVGSLAVASLGADFLFYNLTLELFSRTTSGIVTEKNETIDSTKGGGRVHARTIKYAFDWQGATHGRTDLFGLVRDVETALPEDVYDKVEVGEELSIQHLPGAPWVNRMQRGWLTQIGDYLLALGELATLGLGAAYFRRKVVLPHRDLRKKAIP